MIWFSEKLDIIKSAFLIVLILFSIGSFIFNRTPAPTNGEIINIGGVDYELIETIYDTIYVHTHRIDSVYVPRYVERIRVDTVKLPVIVDSLEIIKAYFSTNRYYDTIDMIIDLPADMKMKADSVVYVGLGNIVVRDDISQNEIIARQIEWNYKFPIIYNTKIVKELPKRQFFIGVSSGINSNFEIANISTNIYLKSKDNKLYRVDFGAIPLYRENYNITILPYIGASVAWPIKF